MLNFRKEQTKSVSIWVFWGLGVEVVELIVLTKYPTGATHSFTSS